MKKKLLSMMLVLSIFDNFVISHVSASCDDSIQDCTKEYIVQINDDNNFNELKKEMSDDDKLVITHDYSDEKYLCKENEMVLDSGIDLHDELSTCNWVDFSEKVSGYKPIDNSGHGTSVAGVIASRINGIGMEGIASEAELYSVKVLNSKNQASVSDVIKGIEWCIDNNIDIINMSFGMDTNSVLLENVVKKAYKKGILMVAAAGNNVSNIQYPAKYEEVISVGSVNNELMPSVFSDNSKVDLVAPGEDAQTLGYLGQYARFDGTSIAAAHVTGIAAAVKSANKAQSVQKLKNRLLQIQHIGQIL